MTTNPNQNRLDLRFVDGDMPSYRAAVKEIVGAGIRTICLQPFGERATALAEELPGMSPDVRISAAERRPDMPLPDGVSDAGMGAEFDATVLLHRDPEALADVLMEFVDLDAGTVVAPITPRYFRNLPLFLISIPKAGTHLLFELVRALGYQAGEELRGVPTGGYWYYIEYSNPHTGAKDFFVDSVRRNSFGNRAHPFPRSPALFIYRNPLDILVSEANWYHADGNAPFGAYLASDSFEARMLKLIDDPRLLGSIRDRVNAFVPWLDFGNVIPFSFEEIVGASGGSSEAAQRRLIWSIMLKLQVPGDPWAIAGAIADTDSPTLRSGRIGAHKDAMSAAALSRVRALPGDFMEAFGYPDGETAAGPLPARAEEFRKRPLALSPVDLSNVPRVVEPGFLGYNIIALGDLYYAVAADRGDLDLTALDDSTLAELTSSPDLQGLKNGIIAAETANILHPRLERDFVGEPEAIESYLGYDVIRVMFRFFAVPIEVGEVDLTKPGKIPYEKGILAENSLKILKLRVAAARIMQCIGLRRKPTAPVKSADASPPMGRDRRA